ncbi:hypothetical protein P2318_13695 [Myxococcaceae bacterium GXIMD 01537]
MLRTIATLSFLLPSLVVAQTLGAPLVGKPVVVNGSPGDQTDPHVSGALVAYTSESSGKSEIRYHDLDTGLDSPIPNSGAFDFVSDISGSTIVFTRVKATSSIFTYDVRQEAPPREIAPLDGANRRGAVIGNRTVAWQDFGYRGTTLEPEIATFNIDTGVQTRLTEDSLLDRAPAVSADGRVIVWTKCQLDGTHCDIWQAAAGTNGFLARQLTGSEGEDVQPDTNGQVVVYSSTRTVGGVTERDIYWQPVGGGVEQRLALVGQDSNPSISGSLVAFERYDTTAERPNFDIYLYNLATGTLYALTRTAENENLNDISVSADGTVRVVWTVPENGDFNVHAFVFRLPAERPPCTPDDDSVLAENVCAAPGTRMQLASVEVSRTTGMPSAASLQFQGEGRGVLCVDNGFNGNRATSGYVLLNGTMEVHPSRFNPNVELVGQRVNLQGSNALAAMVVGEPGASFRVRVYGPPTDVCQPPTSDSEAQVLTGLVIAPVASLVDGAPTASIAEELENPLEGPVGCGAGGGSLATLGLVLIAALRPRR